ncbi:hypothetical protein Tco_1080025 [Tanacetum coccineum]|uniref:Synaptobrevin, longin-like domain protein n=1 Tax=Tanacetum coccineum TaxID=301880 RepID=A0ABQ5HTH7_9ASTR
MVAYLEKSDENAEFHQIFWNTATSKIVNSVKQIHAIVDGKVVVISKKSVRSDLLFDDEDGITCLTNDEIFENLALMGYDTKLTFQKSSFLPQWKFLIHTILHCISSKSTGWNEFSTNLASAVICLTKGQKNNFSKLIFDGMLRNLDPKKFLMHPRFLQLFLNNQLKDLPEPFNDTYETPCHTKKVFSNMARQSKSFSRKVTLLFTSMLVQNQALEGEGSAIPPEPQPTPSTSQPNVLEPQNESLQIETPPSAAPQTAEPQTEAPQTARSHIVFHEAHIEQILPSLTTYHRTRKTHKCRRTKKDIELPQTSVPQDHRADKDSDNILRTQTTAMLNVDIPQGMATGGSPKRQDTMGGKMEQTFELTDTLPPTPHDSPLTGGYIPGSDEGRLKLDELITLCTKLLKHVLDLEQEKDAQAEEILNLKKREDASKQGRKSDMTKPMFKESDFDEVDDLIENVEGETIDAATTGVSTVSAPVTTDGITISTTEPRTPPTTTTIFDDDEDLTIAQTLVKMRSKKAKEKEKGVAFRDEEEPPKLTTTRSTTTLQPLPTIDPKDKVEQEEASMAALYEEYDTIQASIDTDALFAAKLQQEERDQFTIKERAKILVETIEAQRKFRAAKRAAEIRRKSYEELQRLYEREQKWISDFVPMDSEKEAKKTVEPESEGKLAGGTKSAEEAATDYEQEKEKLRMWLPVVPEEEETVDLEIWSAKYPIVDWESQNLGSDIHVYKIIRADGNTSYHKTFSSMLRKFDRQDLVDLHRLVMKKFEDSTPEGYNLLLWGDLKSSLIAIGWYFDLFQHVSREKISSYQGNDGEDVELEARS